LGTGVEIQVYHPRWEDQRGHVTFLCAIGLWLPDHKVSEPAARHNGYGFFAGWTAAHPLGCPDWALPVDFPAAAHLADRFPPHLERTDG
jgi:hypothetical protein